MATTKSRNAFGTLGTWTDYERGYGDPNWKDVNWGGWDASDADFFGDARKFFEDHQVYGQHVGDYGSKNLFDSFGGEYSFYNPGKTVGSHSKWTGGKSDLFKLAKDLYYYESRITSSSIKSGTIGRKRGKYKSISKRSGRNFRIISRYVYFSFI